MSQIILPLPDGSEVRIPAEHAHFVMESLAKVFQKVVVSVDVQPTSTPYWPHQRSMWEQTQGPISFSDPRFCYTEKQ